MLDADWDFASAQPQADQHHANFKEIFTSVVEGELVRKATDEEHYGKFRTLWKDAEPGIAEVEDARRRLAGLKDQ